MDSNSIVVAGSGGHAKVVIEIVELQGCYNIIGVVTNDNISTFEGYKVLGNDEILPQLKSEGLKNIAIGVGGFKNNLLRKSLFEKYISLGFDVPSLIHPKACVSSKSTIGRGVVLFAGCSIGTGVKLCDNVIVATNSSIDHESIIRENVLISAGVTIGANTTIEENSLIALGAKVISGVIVGQNVLVAAGAVVTSNILSNLTVFGIPAKIK